MGDQRDQRDRGKKYEISKSVLYLRYAFNIFIRETEGGEVREDLGVRRGLKKEGGTN